MARRLYIGAYLFLCTLVLSGVFVSVVHAVEISGVSASTTDNAAIVNWLTDINADGTINYGLDTNVGTVRYPPFNAKVHSLLVDGLDPLTTYHFRVISADEKGNRSE